MALLVLIGGKANLEALEVRLLGAPGGCCVPW